MRIATIIGSASIALICGVALFYLGLQDAGDGRTRAVLPIAFGAVLTVGGLYFLRKGLKR
ncbi:sodium:neurotransmitter symporter [Streptomyces sp. SID8360]|nr:sodium:neurotransmitter symporter [Streptomyces sp. SirexAA-E]MYR65235.1 sodium:neurotransmitter symporter [Streptomyces sp. SID4939]MYS04799.1 sodium:neurotransmitter symporter [Streptomyces sp. SID4940]MYT67230.1 sodium:neurotransmitter symporter [Streptomyces sp. SID8357]MYT88084.1 sodium:neurotransmitter symporter [Streptomyces sp. SID8360]MYU32362.1 sodium:neurotransmitter symporter [Streptomyces sp. SID8358]MYW40770.1 sodium:neurotransmitter symporter [Streptomyces sp. SID1]MYX71963